MGIGEKSDDDMVEVEGFKLPRMFSKRWYQENFIDTGCDPGTLMFIADERKERREEASRKYLNDEVTFNEYVAEHKSTM